MSLLTMNCWWSTNTEPSIFSRKFISLCDVPNILATKLCNKLGTNTRAFSSRNSVKKLRRDGQHKNETFPTTRRPSDKYNGQAEGFSSEDDNVRDNDRVSFSESSAAQSSNTVSSSRSTVLKACTNTSGFIAALGVTIRQVCHFASKEGWPILDCSTEISFEFEMWHLQLIAGLVLMVSSCRYLLLKTWPDFAESSEAANRQFCQGLVRNSFSVVHCYHFLGPIGSASWGLLPFLALCTWAVVESFPSLSGQHLLGLHMVMRQLYRQVSLCQWLRMQ
ncbi:uncharacterized protein LOC131144672 isoform X2 [Malania oleifera]|uniref:uncharacterized protein LOC131144672 isoform X2 n=1 Tax=Malania oleifera TaxID=397392 RepID=UPI0025AE3286|nr:uncharacterized protein LOC131144672 isoform X2 [Malania oleifera]